jgi:hypothetical protein
VSALGKFVLHPIDNTWGMRICMAALRPILQANTAAHCPFEWCRYSAENGPARLQGLNKPLPTLRARQATSVLVVLASASALRQLRGLVRGPVCAQCQHCQSRLMAFRAVAAQGKGQAAVAILLLFVSAQPSAPQLSVRVTKSPGSRSRRLVQCPK